MWMIIAKDYKGLLFLSAGMTDGDLQFSRYISDALKVDSKMIAASHQSVFDKIVACYPSATLVPYKTWHTQLFIGQRTKDVSIL